MVLQLALCVIPLAALIVSCVAFNKGVTVLFASLSVCAGFLPVIPIMALQLIVFPAFRGLDSRIATRFLSALILNGLIEELLKFLCLLIVPFKNKPASVCAAGGAIAGLTLGSLESVMYFVIGYERIALRLATAAPIHTFCAMLSAFCIALFKAKKKNPAPVIFAVVIHGVYNFFAGFTGTFWFFSIAALLFAAIECRVQYTKMTEFFAKQALTRGLCFAKDLKE